MNTDDFEQHLAEQPLRQVPAGWRGELLGAARSGARQPDAVAAGPGFAAFLAARLREWLWPHPIAWAGLAAAWVIILGLFAAAEPAPRIDRPATRSLAAFAANRQLQQALLSELSDSPAAASTPAAPAPRSPADRPASPDSTFHPLPRYETPRRT